MAGSFNITADATRRSSSSGRSDAAGGAAAAAVELAALQGSPPAKPVARKETASLQVGLDWCGCMLLDSGATACLPV